jgi:hypothetical protein
MTAIPHRILDQSQMVEYENFVRVLHFDNSYTLIYSSKLCSISRECCHIQTSQHKRRRDRYNRSIPDIEVRYNAVLKKDRQTNTSNVVCEITNKA